MIFLLDISPISDYNSEYEIGLITKNGKEHTV